MTVADSPKLVRLTQRSTKRSLLGSSRLSSGGLPSLDIGESRRFYEEVLGLKVEQTSPERLIVSSGHGYTNIAWWNGHTYIVEKVEAIEQPMVVLNHNGISIDPALMSIDEAHKKITAVKDDYGIRIVGHPSKQHGSYTFYFQDRDANWWEVEHPHARFRDYTGLAEMTVEESRSFFVRTGGEAAAGAHAQPTPSGQSRFRGSALLPVMEITHGTLESHGLQKSRAFYEEVLGLEVQQYGPASICIRGDGGHIYAAVDAPNSRGTMAPQLRNRLWVNNRADVDYAHQLLRDTSDDYDIHAITEPHQAVDGYSFRFQDLDNNWWEIGSYETCGLRALRSTE